MKTRLKLGELLVQAGVLDEYKLNAALAEQQRWGGRLGYIIVSMNFLTEQAIVEALSTQLSIPITDLRHLDVPEWVIKKIDIDFARANSLCPERLASDGKSIVIAMSDPVNIMAIDEIMYRTGMRVQSTLAGERAINRAIGLVYGADIGSFPDEDKGNLFLDNQSVTNEELSALKSEDVSQRQESDAMSIAAEVLEDAQAQQRRALHVMVDLLIDKGVFTREEFLSQVKKV